MLFHVRCLNAKKHNRKIGRRTVDIWRDKKDRIFIQNYEMYEISADLKPVKLFFFFFQIGRVLTRKSSTQIVTM
jgi:hypothetical protein